MHDAFHPELYVAEKTGIFDCQDSKHPQTKKKKKIISSIFFPSIDIFYIVGNVFSQARKSTRSIENK